jgi:hypothetical protein
MTQRQYNFAKNARVIGITLSVVALVLLGFTIFKDKQITASNLITLAAVVVGFISIVINKPTPPPTV